MFFIRFFSSIDRKVNRREIESHGFMLANITKYD